MPVLETSLPLLAVIALGAYLLGSIPFGIFLCRIMGLPDPRTIGSKNIGATNVLRTGSKPAALATLILDSGKAGIAVLIARAIAGEDAAQIAGAAAFFGHLYPVYLGFRGGKGVATFMGLLLALDWRLGLAALAIWIGMALIFRISSLSALTAAALMPLVAWLLGRSDMTILLLLLAVMIFARHRENIRRIATGQETRIRLGRKKDNAG